MQEKSNNFGVKYANQREHSKKDKWISNMAKELEGLEEGLKTEIHINLLRTTLKKYQIGKRQTMMEYMDSDSRNSPPFMTD